MRFHPQQLILFALVLGALGGCSSAPKQSLADNACVATVFRQEGALTQTQRCTEWQFGPSRYQVAAFERNHPSTNTQAAQAEFTHTLSALLQP